MLDLKGELSGAVARYRRAIQLDPANAPDRSDGASTPREDLDEALQLSQRALSAQTKGDSIQDTVGWVYLKRGSIESAVQGFNAALRQNPNRATYHLHLGMALLQKRDLEGSRKALNNALAV